MNNIRLCKRSNVPRLRSPCVRVDFLCLACMDGHICLHSCTHIDLSVCMSASLRPSVCLPACLSVYLSVCDTQLISPLAQTNAISLNLSLARSRAHAHTHTHGLHLRTILLSSARVVSEGSTPTFKITYAYMASPLTGCGYPTTAASVLTGCSSGLLCISVHAYTHACHACRYAWI